MVSITNGAVVRYFIKSGFELLRKLRTLEDIYCTVIYAVSPLQTLSSVAAEAAYQNLLGKLLFQDLKLTMPEMENYTTDYLETGGGCVLQFSGDNYNIKDLHMLNLDGLLLGFGFPINFNITGGDEENNITINVDLKKRLYSFKVDGNIEKSEKINEAWHNIVRLYGYRLRTDADLRMELARDIAPHL